MRTLVIASIFLFLQSFPGYALTVPGTGDSLVVLQRLALEYQRIYPERKIEIPPSIGSTGGIRMLLQGEVELARVARTLRLEEEAQGLKWLEFARSPIVFVGNLPDKCQTNLSSAQVVAVFSGEIDRWSQLGNCPDHKIYLARREAGDSSDNVLQKKIVGLSEIKNKVGKVIYTTQIAFRTIFEHPYTLGYLPLAQVLWGYKTCS